MSILIDHALRVIVQGITGRDGRFHALRMRECGTQIVGGVTPGKGGQTVAGIAVFGAVEKAARDTGAEASVLFVPPPFAADAICEAADAGIALVVAITEGIPVLDVMRALSFLERKQTLLIGPIIPGLIAPGQAMLGILPPDIFRRGRIGVISRSGSLTYEVAHHLTQAGFGQSTCVGIGGDPVIGLGFIELLAMFEADPDTDAVALIGEIGGDAEERAARFIAAKMKKPVVAFIAGQTAPPGKRMGHAGAIIAGGSGAAAGKIAAFEQIGAPVAKEPAEFPELMRRALMK